MTKHRTALLTMVTALAMLCASCQEKETIETAEDTVPEQVEAVAPRDVPIVFTADGETEETKVTMYSTTKVKWEAGDRIGLFAFKNRYTNEASIPAGEAMAEKLTLVSEALEDGGTTTSFTFMATAKEAAFIDEADYYVAVYPYEEGMYDAESTRRSSSGEVQAPYLKYALSSVQSDSQTFSAYAYSNSKTLKFKNLNGVLVFTLNSTPATTFELRSNTPGQVLAADSYRVNFLTGELSPDPDAKTYTSIRKDLVYNSGGPIQTWPDPILYASNYVALPPGLSFSKGFTISFLSAEGQTLYTYSHDKAYTAAKGKVSKITGLSNTSLKGEGAAILTDGKTFNAALKTLMAGQEKSYTDDDSTIGMIRLRLASGVTSDVVVSAADSPFPIYAVKNGSWIDLNTPATEAKYNENSSYMYYKMSHLFQSEWFKLSFEDVVDASHMYEGCSNMNITEQNGTPAYYLPKATDVTAMFKGSGITQIGNVSAPLATSTSDMFASCGSLRKIGKVSIPSSTDAKMMFFGVSVSSLDIEMPKVKNAEMMFMLCSKLQTLTFSGEKPCSLDNVSSMFYYDSALESMDCSALGGNVSKSSDMFWDCSSLVELDLSRLEGTPSDIAYMFNGCSKAKTITLSENFYTTRLSQFNSIFNKCSSLENLYIKGFRVRNYFTPRNTSTFSGVPSTCTIHYCSPSDSGEYTLAEYWDLPEYFGESADSYNWTID